MVGTITSTGIMRTSALKSRRMEKLLLRARARCLCKRRHAAWPACEACARADPASQVARRHHATDLRAAVSVACVGAAIFERFAAGLHATGSWLDALAGGPHGTGGGVPGSAAE